MNKKDSGSKVRTNKSQQDNIYVRWFIRADYKDKLLYDKVLDSEYIEHVLPRILRQNNAIGIVGEYEEKGSRDLSRLGSICVYRLNKKELFLDFVHFDNSSELGELCAKEILHFLTKKLNYQRRNKIEIVVPENNYCLQKILKNTGFLATEVIRDYFFDYINTKMDGYKMEYYVLP